jgi:hypothetical protein
MNKATISLSIVLLLAGCALAQNDSPPRKELTPESLQREIEALQAAKVAWRGIEWKTCLLEGLAASRKQNKPVLLWIFIDRPCDDARC